MTRSDLIRELQETAAWLEERAGVLQVIANNSAPLDIAGALRTEVARLRGRAALLLLIVERRS